MAKRQVLCFQRGAGPKPPDERIPDQSAKIAHRAKASPDSQFLTNRFGFAIGTTDGEVTFKRVFGKEARIVAVLFRPEWRSTKWTALSRPPLRRKR